MKNVINRETLRVAWGGVISNKVRSGLTVLGVVIGVATVIALLSIGQGTQDAILEQITGGGSDLVFVTPGGNSGPTGGDGPGTSSTAPTLLTDEDVAALEAVGALPDAVAVVPRYAKTADVSFGDERVGASVVGTTEAYQAAYGSRMDHGRFLLPSDSSGADLVAVLGAETASSLFGGFDPVGQRVQLNLATGDRVPVTIVGVLAEQDVSAVTGNVNASVFVPLSTARTRLFDARDELGRQTVTSLAVQAEEGASAALVSQVEVALRDSRDLGPDDEDDFAVTSQEDLLSMAEQVTGILTTFLGVIAAISLVVGGIGIMNIMLVSVTERTREIGIRKAVGARRNDILGQFLLEALVLSIIGGLLGIALGAVVSWAVGLSGFLSTSVSPSAVGLAFGFSLAVGLLSGVYPARRASRLLPIDALRYE
jgi:putative ABC transport system permease protein